MLGGDVGGLRSRAHVHRGLRVIAWLIPVRRQREQPALERRELLSLSGGSCRRGLATISRALGKLCGERGCPRAPAAPTPDAFPPPGTGVRSCGFCCPVGHRRPGRQEEL